MDFIRRLLEQKVAAAVGQPVTLGNLSVSPLSGSVDIRELVVGTLLRVKRVQAKISLARALKQEIVVKSLTIKSPQITLDGPPPRPPAKAGGPSKTAWSFEAEQVLVVDGQITYRDPASGYTIAIEKLDGSVRRTAGGRNYEFTLAAPTSGRRDQPVELGPAKIWGTFADDAIDGQLQVGTIVDAKASTAAIKTGPWMASVEIIAALELMLRLLPPQVKLPITAASGEVTLLMAATVKQGGDVSIDRFSVASQSAGFHLQSKT